MTAHRDFNNKMVGYLDITAQEYIDNISLLYYAYGRLNVRKGTTAFNGSLYICEYIDTHNHLHACYK